MGALGWHGKGQQPSQCHMEKPYVHISNKDQTAKKCFQASRDTELKQGMILIQPENIFHIQAVSKLMLIHTKQSTFS